MTAKPCVSYNKTMLIFLIPTAKEMAPINKTYPQTLNKKSTAIVEQMAELPTNDLAKLYKIKIEAAEEELRRWEKLAKGSAQNSPALNLFNGLMYRNIKRDLSVSEEDYVRKHLYITSSLYGIIPAFQPIAPHRLDFNIKIKVNGQSLKAYWREDFDKFTKQSNTIISLLSSEFEEVFSTASRQNFIRLKFMEEKNGQLKVHSTISKKARGKFLTAAIENNCDNFEDIKNLTFDGFSYQKILSNNNELVFVKKVSEIHH